MASIGSTPSTQWRERIAPDEAARFERHARQFALLQQARSAALGPGRALHRRQLQALRAQFEVLGDLPAHASRGLFAQPARYEAWVRLSNGSSGHEPDRKPDVRGFAIKVLGVHGPGALGLGATSSQDFLLIQRSSTAFVNSEQFVEVALASARGPVAVIGTLVRRHGLLGGLRQLRRIAGGIRAPFSGFATERFYSALPIACEPYAVRVRLLPPSGESVDPGARDRWAEDMNGRLRQRSLVYELQLQFFVDEATTPIEDGSVDWPESAAPYVTVARLSLPAQTPEADLQRQVEAAAFDPWSALMEHRPLGELMRARKVVYYASQQGRKAGP
jgi:hypothetical protein